MCEFLSLRFRSDAASVAWREEVSRRKEGWLGGIEVGVCVCVCVFECISMYEVRKWKGAYC